MKHLILNDQFRPETDEAIIATLRRKGWHDAPAQPTPDSVWQNGEWVIPPAHTSTAEEHLAQSGYNPLRLLTCLDLEAKLRAANATSAPLAAVRSWLDGLTLAAATNPDAQRPDWPAAPFPFDTVLADALAHLQPQ